MKRISRTASTQIIAGFAFTLGGLLLISTGNRAYAGGYFATAPSTTPPSEVASSDPGTYYGFTAGSTLSVFCSSNYAAQPTSPSTKGGIVVNAQANFVWVNSDGNSPYPTANSYSTVIQGSASGIADASGCNAASSTNTGAQGSAPQGGVLNYSSSNSVTVGPFPTLPNSISLGEVAQANTSAGPDRTADPSKEKYGNPTSAASSSTSKAYLSYSGGTSV